MASRSTPVFHQLLEAITAHDLDRIAECFAENARYVDSALGWKLTGRREICDMYRPWFDCTDLSCTPDDLHFTNGDQYASSWVLTGAVQRPLSGTWAEGDIGHHFEARGVTIGRLDYSGLIALSVDYWNPADLAPSPAHLTPRKVSD